MKKFSAIFVIFCFVFIINATAKTPKHIKMMKDKKVNFYDVVKEANKYFKDKDKGRGSGYKQFKRWEYHWGQRLYPSGERTNLANPVQEWASFNAESASESTAAWTELGPDTFQNNSGSWNPGLGRINDIVMDPNNSSIIYVGTPNGGLWRTTTGGNSWTPLTDHIPAIGVSCILVDPNDSNLIYIGTGDRDAYDCWSRGVLKSTDGGATWNATGMTFVPTQWQQIKKMLFHPNDSTVIWAATYYGLYKSTDSAASWNLILDGDVDDLEFKPGDPSIMYAVTNNVPSPIFYRSTDGGNTFVQGSMSSNNRAVLAVTPAAPDYVYYFAKDVGCYRSEDSGVSFARKGRAPTAGSQDWYDLAIAVSPVNADEVHVGEIETFVSTNGGRRFTKTAIWSYPNNTGYVHADIHEMVYFGNRLYVGSDGMITYTDDSASSWVDLTEGLANRQFYRIGSGVNGSPYKLVGGSQDNGTSVYSTDHWHDWLGADGMECVINYNDPNIIYGCIQYGSFYKSTDGGNNSVSVSQPGGGDWVTPYVIDPIDPNTLYVGNASIRKTTNGMGSWSTLFSNFGTGNVNALAVAKSNPNYIYCAKDSQVWRTTNGGGAWTEITGSLPGYHVTYISVHPTNPEKVAVTCSSFWTYADGEKVYTSANAGTTWTNYSSNLPNLPVMCVAYHGGANDAMYVGMDIGVYYRDNTMSTWTNYTGNLPNVQITELEYDDNIGKLRAATFGRGLWEVDLYSEPSTDPPVADFTADKTSVYEGETVSFTDLSTNGPTSWAWTFAGGTPGTSPAQNPTVTYNTAGTYDVTLIATNANGSDTETKPGYITVSVAPQLPTYCTSTGTDVSKEWIAGVAVGGFSNSSGAAGYSDFTGLTVELTAGASASVTLTPGKTGGKPQNEYWKIWIDANADGDFDDAGEEVFSGTAKSTTAVTGSFTVPSGVVYTGMRVAMKRDAYATSCETFTYGEVEDYAVNISASASASVSPYQVSIDPPQDNLFIKHASHSGSLHIRVYNSNGKLVKNIAHNGGLSKRISISELPPGSYKAVIHNGQSQSEQYFVKK
jgi:PKD repeat protein